LARRIIPFLQRQKKLAIEIGSDWIKIAEAVWTPAGYEVSKFKARRLLDIKDNLSSGIKALLEEMAFKGKGAILIIPRYFITIRELELPSTNPGELAEIIDLQVSKQTPYSRSEITFDFKIIESVREGYSKVLLVIVKKNIIEERLKILKESGLEPESVRISSETAYQYLSSREQFKEIEKKVTAVIDIDSYFSDCLVINKGNLLFTRNIFTGRDFISKNPDTWKEKFIEEIKKSLELFQHEAEKVGIENIVLTGATEGLTDLPALIRNALNLPAHTLDIDKTALSTEETAKNISLSALFGALCSIEEPRINLLPREAEIERQMKAKAKNITHTGILSILILVLLSAFLLERFYIKNHYYEALCGKFTKTEKEATEVERMKLRVNMIRDYLDKKNSAINILQSLFSVTPKEVYFSNINYTKDKEVILTGVSETMSDVFKFVTVLEELDYFEKVKTNYATKKKKEEREVVSFELICPLTE
jgi:Tfp pilus assembly PilM family ATPase/Tfp pilus assembly protein PilN